MRRVFFTNGEGLDTVDLNMMGQLGSRALGLLMEGAARFGGTTAIRVLSGGEISTSGASPNNRTVTLTEGHYLLPVVAGSQDDPGYRVGRHAGAVFNLAAVSGAGQWRRDIIQVRVDAEASGENATRDFEDAVTRAITSSSTPKRYGATATISVKQGTETASEATAVAPSPDAGYEVLYEIAVRSSAADFDVDWGYVRHPMAHIIGGRKLVTVHGSGLMPTDPGSGDDIFDSTDGLFHVGAAAGSAKHPLSLPVGARIHRMRQRVENSATVGSRTFRLTRSDGLTNEFIGTTMSSSASFVGEVWTENEPGSFPVRPWPHTLEAGWSYFIEVSGIRQNDAIPWIQYEYDLGPF